MLRHRILRCAFLILTLTAPAAQVDITITVNGNSLTGNAIILSSLGLSNRNSVPFAIATCPNIPPGVCCQPPRRLAVLGSRVNFTNLHVTDIAAVWTGKPIEAKNRGLGIVRGCSGRLLTTAHGPGNYVWQLNNELAVWGRRAEGASYITLPTSLPPDPNTSKWLMMEGLLALSWGGGRWFANSGTERLLGASGSGVKQKRQKVRRGVHSAERGTVYARPPLRVRHPTFIEINGIRFSDGGAGDSIYTDQSGNVLNLTESLLE